MKNRVGFGPRLGAFLLDIVITSAFAFILVKLLPGFFEGLVNWDAMSDQEYEGMQMMFKGNTDFFLAYTTSVGLIGLLYNLTDGFLGRTPGKMILGLMIADKEGEKASIEKLMARFALKNIGSIFAVLALAITISAVEILGQVLGIVALIGFFFALGEGKLALHDMIAKTAVYKKTELEESTEE